MPRPLYRATLECGFKLDINRLARNGFIRPGAATGPVGIRWRYNYSDEVTDGIITADLSDTIGGWFRIRIGNLDQHIYTVARRRHFGGRQWFFRCPYLHQRCMVLWMPPGADSFACRERWGRSVAYASQFSDPTGRAHQGKAKINARICRIGGYDPDEWEFPPKPKWMRWRTYNRAEAKFDRYEAALNDGLMGAAIRLGFRP
jgi:hypothetical protein